MNAYEKIGKLTERISEAEFYRFYSGYAQLKGTSGWVTCSSPLREGDTKPSFSINLTCGVWKDFANGETGNIVTFLERKHNYDTGRIIEILEDMAGRPDLEEPDPQPKPQKPKKRQKALSAAQIAAMGERLRTGTFREAKIIQARFATRKIDIEVAVSYGVGISDDMCLLYPVHWQDDECTGYKKYPIRDGQKSNIPINCPAGLFPRGPISKKIVIAEGEDDCLGLLSHDIPAKTNNSGAGTWEPEWCEQFRGCTVTLLYDNDEAGRKGTLKAASMLQEYAELVLIAQWPAGSAEGYDVGDWFSEGRTAEELQTKVLDKARIFVPYALYSFGAELPQSPISDIIEQKEIERIQRDIYHHSTNKQGNETYTLIPKKVVELMLQRHKLCCTERNSRTVWYIYENGFWQRRYKKQIGALFYDWFRDSECKAYTIDNIISMLAYKCFVTEDLFNTRTDLINLNNCAYDLVTFRPVPHSPNHYFTWKTEYDYDPGAECPTYDRELWEYSMHDRDWMQLCWEIHGYVMLGDLPLQKMFWFFGTGGRNGKGTVMRVMENLLTKEVVKFNFDPDQLKGRFYLKALEGARLATLGDMPVYLSNLSKIKQLTGGDRQTSDVKNQDEISFYSFAKLVFAMNHMPDIGEHENRKPIAKRVKFLPFDYRITKEDGEIEKIFKREISGIFNRAIVALQRLMQKREFTHCERSEVLSKRFLGEGNSIKAFIQERFEITNSKTDYVFQHSMWDGYEKFMQKFAGHNWRTHVYGAAATKAKFCTRLRENYGFQSGTEYDSDKGGRYTVFYGISGLGVEAKDTDGYVDPKNDKPF